MALKAVLFDLDGTLLPLKQDEFLQAYFTRLTAYMAQIGFEPKKLYETIYAGCVDMLKNDGKNTNEQVFWDKLVCVYGESVLKEKPVFESFYKTDFLYLKEFSRTNPEAKKLITLLKAMGIRVILATNPVFPIIATHARIGWAGLEKEDFEVITAYENSRFCKPSTEYYADILEKAALLPEECLMVGNDVDDDMPAQNTGMKVFLLTDCLINRNKKDISAFEHGNFEKLTEYIKKLVENPQKM